MICHTGEQIFFSSTPSKSLFLSFGFPCAIAYSKAHSSTYHCFRLSIGTVITDIPSCNNLVDSSCLLSSFWHVSINKLFFNQLHAHFLGTETLNLYSCLSTSTSMEPPSSNGQPVLWYVEQSHTPKKSNAVS